MRPRSFLLRVALAIAALLVVWTGGSLPWAPLAPRAAYAQPDAYKQHMKNGVKLYQDGNFDAALVEFGAAYKAEAKANPLVNIALCHKGLFNYPKAIAALELALSKHVGTMDAGDKKAAEDAITEMRGLLAFVTVTVKPPAATLIVDGEDQPAGTASKPVPLGPGTHRIGARLGGYASAEQSVTVASGEKSRVVTLTLLPNQGFLTVRGDDANTRIIIDQRQVGVGSWSGLLDLGTHTVQLDKPGTRPYEVHVLIIAGQAQEVRRGFGGIPIGAPAPPMPVEPPPPPKKKPEPEAPPKRGFFVLGMGSLLLPTAKLQDPHNNEATVGSALESGGAVGLRAGYRVNTPASFDLMFEYGNVSDEFEEGVRIIDYSLSSYRFGLNLRLMTPGQTVRLVGSIGGGLVIGDLSVVELDRANGMEVRYEPCGCFGPDGFLQGEIGIELEFGGVILGAAFRNQFQSSKGMNYEGRTTAENYNPYGNDPLIFVGGGLSIGYGLW